MNFHARDQNILVVGAFIFFFTSEKETPMFVGASASITPFGTDTGNHDGMLDDVASECEDSMLASRHLFEHICFSCCCGAGRIEKHASLSTIQPVASIGTGHYQ